MEVGDPNIDSSTRARDVTEGVVWSSVKSRHCRDDVAATGQRSQRRKSRGARKLHVLGIVPTGRFVPASLLLWLVMEAEREDALGLMHVRGVDHGLQ
eukprot:3076940-Rhodomonas_salina.1